MSLRASARSLAVRSLALPCRRRPRRLAERKVIVERRLGGARPRRFNGGWGRDPRREHPATVPQ